MLKSPKEPISPKLRGRLRFLLHVFLMRYKLKKLFKLRRHFERPRVFHFLTNFFYFYPHIAEDANIVENAEYRRNFKSYMEMFKCRNKN